MFKHNFSVWKIVLIVWLVFTTLYFFYDGYDRLANYVYKNGYNTGITTAVTQIITESEKCQPIPINVDDKKATLINVDCLKQQAEEAAE